MVQTESASARGKKRRTEGEKAYKAPKATLAEKKKFPPKKESQLLI